MKNRARNETSIELVVRPASGNNHHKWRGWPGVTAILMALSDQHPSQARSGLSDNALEGAHRFQLAVDQVC
jgi:hypothetical protein